MTDQPQDGTGHEQPIELRESNPNASGPDRAAGGMGVSSERVGHTGGGVESTDGERDTSARDHRDDAGDIVGADAETEPEQEENPTGIEPKAGYPSKDPRSKDLPYK
jgi:hypothetical protein